MKAIEIYNAMTDGSQDLSNLTLEDVHLYCDEYAGFADSASVEMASAILKAIKASSGYSSTGELHDNHPELWGFEISSK